MAIDKEAIKEHVRGILIALGDDPDREGLIETPDRVAGILCLSPPQATSTLCTALSSGSASSMACASILPSK